VPVWVLVPVLVQVPDLEAVSVIPVPLANLIV